MTNEQRIQFIKDMDLVQQISAKWSGLVDTSDLTREAVWLSDWAHRPVGEIPKLEPISREPRKLNLDPEDMKFLRLQCLNSSY